ncbi:MAG: penicillin acylase family protein [Sandaracinaceae bacterium]
MLRRFGFAALCALLGLSLFSACDEDPPEGDGGVDGSTPEDPAPPEEFAAIEESGRFPIPGLSGHAHVVRTEHDIPHIYAENRGDAWRVLGFVMAKDRFFQMDLTARLAQGTLSELLGDAALGTDLENRQTGATHMTDVYLDALTDDEAEELDCFAEGVNAYIEAVRRRDLDPPAELEIGFAILGARRPVELMESWDRRDVVATGATILYATSFETGDPRRASAFEGIENAFTGAPDRDLRLAGLQEDIIERYAPPNSNSSAAGWGVETAGGASESLEIPRVRRPIPLDGPEIEAGAMRRLGDALSRVESRLHPNGHEGWGSNSWAVMGSATPDGRSLLAGDGHLQLSVPALFWQYGLDTRLMGSDDGLRLRGATIAGLPMMGVGTNGRVAWTQTAYFADVTDWYAEEIVLDAEGMPASSVFGGENRPLVAVEETFDIAEVAALDSVGRVETIPRFTTFDGRFITSIEGREVTADEPLADGESRVNMMGQWVVPADMDADGKISAVSFYYGPFDGGSLLRAFREFITADNVEDYRQAMRHFIGYGGSMMASDADGSVLYSAYHAVPCRDYLPRDSDSNVWVEGADPRRLIDGTQYPAWGIPLDAQGRVDEAAATAGGDTACAVPFEQWPQAVDPERQYVFHANNDPGNIATDDDLFDDPFYIGGPWIEGYRARRIEELLTSAIADDTADFEEMQAIQGDHHSQLGEDYASLLLEIIAGARAASEGSPEAGTSEERMATLFTANEARFEEVETRIQDWRDADFPTPSGVETFYNTPDAADRANSVATMIFAAWFPRFTQGVLNDEGINRNLSPAVTGDTFTTMTIKLLLDGRGADNPGELGSWNPATEESVFFDDIRTSEVESSLEVGLLALRDTLDFLTSDPSAAGEGGFGTATQDEWVWGLRHQVRFESLLADFLGDEEALGALFEQFNITTSTRPLAESLPDADPRADLRWFPRPGDQFDIDAANPGLGGVRFTHGSGPVFRLVIGLGPDGVTGQNILPGGQSGLPNAEAFSDQAASWLANETVPIRYTPTEVAQGATSRERFFPARAE